MEMVNVPHNYGQLKMHRIINQQTTKNIHKKNSTVDRAVFCWL